MRRFTGQDAGRRNSKLNVNKERSGPFIKADIIESPPAVVWFKRDLRLSDHAALVSAASAGPVLPIYVVEPVYWSPPYTSYRQWEFLRGAVVELKADILAHSGQLGIRLGTVQDALEQIKSLHGPFRLVPHMETGNAWTYTRDIAVTKWCDTNKIEFEEFQQYGVWRGSDLSRNKVSNVSAYGSK